MQTTSYAFEGTAFNCLHREGNRVGGSAAGQNCPGHGVPGVCGKVSVDHAGDGRLPRPPHSPRCNELVPANGLAEPRIDCGGGAFHRRPRRRVPVRPNTLRTRPTTAGARAGGGGAEEARGGQAEGVRAAHGPQGEAGWPRGPAVLPPHGPGAAVAGRHQGGAGPTGGGAHAGVAAGVRPALHGVPSWGPRKRSGGRRPGFRLHEGAHLRVPTR
mmetsp:Transcript_17990/g.45566  ORF Transcript_17990/g.45566 Transcript_17990/m.45566 type:complete len:214 (+) Transcript_17990:1862-2503(+)